MLANAASVELVAVPLVWKTAEVSFAPGRKVQKCVWKAGLVVGESLRMQPLLPAGV